MPRTGTITRSVVEIILAVLLLFCAAVVAIVGFGFVSDPPHHLDRDVGIVIFCWQIAIAMTATRKFRKYLRWEIELMPQYAFPAVIH